MRITDKGVADKDNRGKFDEEVVYKGTRFKFRLELIGNEEDAGTWETLLANIDNRIFRLGGGTTRGFGDIRVLHEHSSFEIFNIADEKYRNSTASLNETYDKPLPKNSGEMEYTHYHLHLQPDDFSIFGSGFGDDDADMTPVYEQVVDYDKGRLSEEKILIPASSIKGAVAHRTAYHYNKLKGRTIEKGDGRVGEENEAVNAIFGEKKDENRGKKGIVLMSDCFLKKADEKVFDHVAIDRFTGGAIESALFQEKTVAGVDRFGIDIYLKPIDDKESVEAFEKALGDICTGLLPLGGSVTKGHGVFHGELLRNGEKI